MRSFNQVIFVVVVIVLIVHFWNNADDDKSDTSTTAVSNTPAVGSSSWPYLDDNANPAILGTDTLANNIYVVFDVSGSMGNEGCSGNQSKADAAKDALLAFSNEIPSSTNLGMLAFDGGGISERAPLASGPRDQFNMEVMRVTPGGGTPLRSAINLAYDKLTEQARRQLGYGNYHLVVVTDGEASNGESPDAIVRTILVNSPIVMHTIGFCIRQNHSLNQPGKVLYKSAMNTRELQSGLSNVLAEAPDFKAVDFK